MFRQTFYFGTIRKYVTLFGTLFDDILIERTDSAGDLTALIKVPITYGPKEKMLARTLGDPDIDRQTATPTLPVMSFEMTNISYDSSRKLNTIRRTVVSDSDPNRMKYQYAPVAYNIGFRLHVYVKNAEDGTKIIEQILPYFTPDWTTTVQLIPEMEITLEIPVILDRISQEDTYDGSFKERRALTWTLDFTLKGYIYGPIKKGSIIKFANTIYYAPSGNLLTSIGNTDPNMYYTVQPGLTANGLPTANGSQSIDPNLITATSDFGYVENVTVLTT
jgi:hypothetical protein